MKIVAKKSIQWALLVASVAALVSACSATMSAEEVADEQELANTYKEHANDSPVPSPMAWTEPAQSVTGEAVAYTTVDGKQIQGWMARPANINQDAVGELPALVVIHQWWGLDGEEFECRGGQQCHDGPTDQPRICYGCVASGGRDDDS